MHWSDAAERIENDGKVVLASHDNGQWMRISKEVCQILDEIVAHQENPDTLRSAFESPEDYEYVVSLLKLLVKSGILTEKPDAEEPVDSEGSVNIQAALQLTNRCNLRCRHCCVSAGEDMQDPEADTLTMMHILDKLIEWEPRSIMLSGGEPLIREDFFVLLHYLRNNYNGKILLSTNSLLIDEINAADLVDCCDQIDISLDGIDEESCASVRGRGVFGKVCDHIQILHRHGFEQINVSMVFSDKNEHLIGKFRELNDRLGTNPICRTFSPVGRGARNWRDFTDKTEEDVYIPAEYLRQDFNEAFGISTCKAGRREVFIRCNGDIYPCPSYMARQFMLGNILTAGSLKDLLKDKAEAGSHADSPVSFAECRDCKVSWFCWTCPGERLEIKTQAAFCKRCAILKPLLYYRVWESNINMKGG